MKRTSYRKNVFTAWKVPPWERRLPFRLNHHCAIIFGIGLMVAGIFAISIPSQLYGQQTFAENAIWDEYRPCGVTALYIVARLKGSNLRWQQLKGALGPGDKDELHSFADLRRVANASGMECVGLRTSVDDLVSLPMPAIVQTLGYHGDNQSHLSVILGATDNEITLLDAPHAPSVYPASAFNSFWTGNILLFPTTTELARGLEAEYYNRDLARRLRTVILGELCLISLLLGMPLIRRLIVPVRSLRRLSISLKNRRIRRHIIVGLSIATGLVLTGVIVHFANEHIPAALVLDRGTLELGFVDEGTKRFEFSIRNSGWTRLQLNDIVPSCTCVSAIEKPEFIASGGEARVAFSLHTLPGQRTITFAINSNDPHGPQIKTVHWLGGHRPLLMPRSLEFGPITLGRPMSRDVRLLFRAGDDAAIPTVESVQCSTPALVASVADVSRNAYDLSGYSLSPKFGVLTIRLLATVGGPLGQHRESCDLRVRNGSKSYEYHLPITYDVQGPIESNYNALVFCRSEGSGGRHLSRRVALSCSKDTDLEMKAPSWCKCVLNKNTAGESFLEITVEQLPSGKDLVEDAVMLRDVKNPAAQSSIALYVY